MGSRYECEVLSYIPSNGNVINLRHDSELYTMSPYLLIEDMQGTQHPAVSEA